jgi:phosphohistidine phosphatase
VPDYIKFAAGNDSSNMEPNKVLHIVRHAKSSWDMDGIADIDRTLKAKGIRNAYEISRRMKLNHYTPDLIISSPADRALHTAVVFARVLEFPLSRLVISNLLYETSKDNILNYLKSTPEENHSLMIFGHNPDITDLVNHFIQSPVENVPTCGAVSLTFNCLNWNEINAQNLSRSVFFFPNGNE